MVGIKNCTLNGNYNKLKFHQKINLVILQVMSFIQNLINNICVLATDTCFSYFVQP